MGDNDPLVKINIEDIQFHAAQVVLDGIMPAGVQVTLPGLIVLNTEDGRSLTLMLGGLDIEMLLMGVLAKDQHTRPLTHDIAIEVLKAAGMRVTRVIIRELKDCTFFADLVVRMPDGSEKTFDCRPSDGINFAVRIEDIEMYVRESVLIASEDLDPPEFLSSFGDPFDEGDPDEDDPDEDGPIVPPISSLIR